MRRRRMPSLATAAVLTAAALAVPSGAAARADTARGANPSPPDILSIVPGLDPLRPSSRPVTLVDAQRDLHVTYTSNGATKTLNDYMVTSGTQGFLVLDGNRIVTEWYAPGFGKNSRFQSWSMAKSYTGDAVGIALAEGRIHSLDDTVAKYVPELANADYGKVTLYNLLRMSSGIGWDETTDDIAMHPAFSLGLSTPVQWAAGRRTVSPQGSKFNYTSLNSALLAQVVANVYGMPFTRFLQKRIWEPTGMADTDYVGTDSHGHALGYCCIYATDRDFARFGKMMLDGGRVAGRTVVPASWVERVHKPSGVSPSYGLQWWIDGTDGYYASGLGGQVTYVDPARKVVIVRSTFYSFNDTDTLPALHAVARAVAAQRTRSAR
ncbi:serine hydrolase domain-containing protein [Actinomadura oligospora]|uniref:serine hydrolase domain-containing protein n=1 Tax=Actinomadura oligospora TaxID=111804 RepID=UPI00047E6E3A|nr:serine hydrolase [Actinomadura oligospora]